MTHGNGIPFAGPGSTDIGMDAEWNISANGDTWHSCGCSIHFVYLMHTLYEMRLFRSAVPVPLAIFPNFTVRRQTESLPHPLDRPSPIRPPDEGR